MSKNPTIQEGGTARNFRNVAKLETDLIGGGTQFWVPEDEAIDYVEKGKLTANEQKTYYPDEYGLQAFDEVEVDLSDQLGTLTVTKKKTYIAEDDNLLGYEKVIVDMEGQGKVKPLTIYQKGVYDVSEEAPYIEDGEQKYYIGYNPINAEYDGAEMQSLDVYENGTYTAPEGVGYNQVNVYIEGTTSEDENGNKTLWQVERDDSGNVIINPETNKPTIYGTAVPAALEIVTQPNKLSYEYGETMDYTGLTARMLNGDGTTFTDATHSNGILQLSELTLPLKEATSSRAPVRYLYSGKALISAYLTLDVAYKVAEIKITTPPTKLEYQDGETIDFTGIVVTAYDDKGNVYTDERYPDGKIPFRELTFPVRIAGEKSAGNGGGNGSSTPVIN